MDCKTNRQLRKELAEAHDEIERLRVIEKAAQWFADNPDSPVSALAHIREALVPNK